ncbi:MAG: hypothetical protein R3338_06730, partial [Thermoanaerobaculia bacterium]|nr:hypothetical protein [Thermoanaerobaculia bacterium]
FRTKKPILHQRADSDLLQYVAMQIRNFTHKVSFSPRRVERPFSENELLGDRLAQRRNPVHARTRTEH